MLPEPYAYLADEIPVTPAEAALLRASYAVRTVPRHAQLLAQGQPCRELWFVQRGLLRSYYATAQDEVTCWAATAGEFMTSLLAFTQQTPSPENIQAVEPSQLLVLPYAAWQRLYAEHPSFRERWRLGVEARFAQLEQRLGAMRALGAADRYAYLQGQHPQLTRQLPLKYLASILGMEARHLSRLRAADAGRLPRQVGRAAK